MLTLTRREGEELIMIIDQLQLEVVVTEIRGNQVRLSIDAPSSVLILRDELLDEYGPDNASPDSRRILDRG